MPPCPIRLTRRPRTGAFFCKLEVLARMHKVLNGPYGLRACGAWSRPGRTARACRMRWWGARVDIRSFQESRADADYKLYTALILSGLALRPRGEAQPSRPACLRQLGCPQGTAPCGAGLKSNIVAAPCSCLLASIRKNDQLPEVARRRGDAPSLTPELTQGHSPSGRRAARLGCSLQCLEGGRECSRTLLMLAASAPCAA